MTVEAAGLKGSGALMRNNKSSLPGLMCYLYGSALHVIHGLFPTPGFSPAAYC